MALPPLSPNSGLSANSPAQRSAIQVKRSGESNAQASEGATAAANAAQQEASRRAEEAREMTKQVERDAEVQLSHLKDSYDRQMLEQTLREENALESQRVKGYEAIRELQRQQQAELNRVRHEGERELGKMTTYYADTTYAMERDGDKKLRDLSAKQHITDSFAENSSKLAQDELKSTHAQRLESLKNQTEIQANEYAVAQEKRIQDLKQNSMAAQTAAETLHRDRYAKTLETFDSEFNRINAEAGQQLRQVRADTAQKLAAYSSRQNDPFYKALDLGAEINESEDAYVLTARIPEHEQDHVRVNVMGDRLVISGSRRNEEKQELGPGRFQTTGAYQSYSESFPLSWPVDSKDIRKVFDGEKLTVVVPKKNQFSKRPAYTKPAPEKLRAERPQFPFNLPMEKGRAEAGAPAEPSTKGKGSKPLT